MGQVLPGAACQQGDSKMVRVCELQEWLWLLQCRVEESQPEQVEKGVGPEPQAVETEEQGVGLELART